MSGTDRPDQSLADANGDLLAPADGNPGHEGVFGSEIPPPEGYGIVVGNCQAESLRIVLDAPDRPFIRIPAVHELTAADAARLHELLAGAAVLVSQPISDDYHDLPLGTRQLRAALPPGARTVVVPSVRFAGLHPFQAAVRIPPAYEDPPLVAYHDVRTLAAAAGESLPRKLPGAVVRAIAEDSRASLGAREEQADVRVSDLFAEPRFGQMRTVNHPGNAVFLPLAERILDALGDGSAPRDPGRPLLSSVQAPREAWVAEAWGLPAEATASWTVEGRRVDPDEVEAAHRRWYADRPAYVAAAMTRLAPLVARWRSA